MAARVLSTRLALSLAFVGGMATVASAQVLDEPLNASAYGANVYNPYDGPFRFYSYGLPPLPYCYAPYCAPYGFVPPGYGYYSYTPYYYQPPSYGGYYYYPQYGYPYYRYYNYFYVHPRPRVQERPGRRDPPTAPRGPTTPRSG